MIAPVNTSLSFLYILFAANPSVRPWGPHDFLAVLFRAKNCVELNGSARPWGPHDFLAVLFGAKTCVEVNGVKKVSKTPS
ncbi:hypothetical protein YC2023_033381 [Brassica napus]